MVLRQSHFCSATLRERRLRSLLSDRRKFQGTRAPRMLKPQLRQRFPQSRASSSLLMQPSRAPRELSRLLPFKGGRRPPLKPASSCCQLARYDLSPTLLLVAHSEVEFQTELDVTGWS